MDVLQSFFPLGVSPHADITQTKYQNAKYGVHAVDYGCKKRTLAFVLQSLESEAERFINTWFAAHPDIQKWQFRVERELFKSRTVRNAWGFRRVYFDRIEGILPEALDWRPS